MCFRLLCWLILYNSFSRNVLESEGATITRTPNDTATTLSHSQTEETCLFMPDSNPHHCATYLENREPPLILISLDGFRPEYLNRSVLMEKGGLAAPTIDCLIRQGVSAPFMMPSYPTITFPNHYSIVTGLYPESHQIIGNSFFDPDLNATFSIRQEVTNPKWWRNGEPIWTTIRKQGKVSATYFWPGSDVAFPPEEERNPTHFFKYNKSVSFQRRVDQILEWMDLPTEQRPSIATLYFEEPDATGHAAGPNTPNVTEKVTVVDYHIRKLVDGLAERNILSCVNIIIVSDHGMAELSSTKKIDLSLYAPDLQQSAMVFYGPVTSIRPENDTYEEEELLSGLLACNNPHMRVFNKWDLPYRMHSAHSRRIPSVMLDFDLGWRGLFKTDSYPDTGGAHGWDNLNREMQAIFVAHGPSFKKGVVVRPFENIELYNLMCALVNVAPAENNGTWGALHHFLVNPPAAARNESLGEESLHKPHILRETADDPRKRIRNACRFLRTAEFGGPIVTPDLNLNMTREKEDELLRVHAPLGIPMLADQQSVPVGEPYTPQHYVLVNEDYLTSFDTEYGLPLWTSYTIAGQSNATNDKLHYASWIDDYRLGENAMSSCQRLSNVYNSEKVTFKHLFPKELATRPEAAWLDTNLLEVPQNMSDLIQTMTQLLSEAAAIRGPINVVSGPTRHHSPALFYVASSCKSSTPETTLATCPMEERDVQAFLLPVRQKLNRACMADKDFIAFNVATLRDVERLTSYVFFPDLPFDERIDLIARSTLDSQLVVNPAKHAHESGTVPPDV